MKLTAITKVLAQYKNTSSGFVTQTMIEDAWLELQEAESQLRHIHQVDNESVIKILWGNYKGLLYFAVGFCAFLVIIWSLQYLLLYRN